MTASIPVRRNQKIFRFGGFELDSGRRRLVRAGKVVSLPPKPMSLLILLLESAGALVAKEIIVRELWGDDEVSDNSLFQVAGIVRKTLGTLRGGGQFLDRHARGGYRLVVPVTFVEYAAPLEESDTALEPFIAFVQGWAALESLDRAAVERARVEFAARLAANPDSGPDNIGMANALLLTYETTRADQIRDDNLLNEAERHARRGCALAVGAPHAWATLAVVRYRRGDPLEAVAAMRKALAIDPQDWRLHLRLAWVSWGEERLAAARRTLGAVPGQPLAHWFAATVYVARGLLELARQELRAGCESQDLQLTHRAADRVKFSAVGLHWLHGLVLYALGDEDGALRELSREIAFEGGGQLWAREASANSWYALGAIHSQAGRADEARAAFAQALARVANHPMATLYLSPASPLHSVTGGGDGVLAGAEATVALAVYLVLRGRDEEAAGLCAEMLHRERYGSAAWWLPVEPTLRVAARGDVWTLALGVLRARAR